MTRVTRIQPGERIRIPLNQLHRNLILDHADVSAELEARIRTSSASVSLDLDELDELLGVHAQAGRSKIEASSSRSPSSPG
jgi:hypothetical protein